MTSARTAYSAAFGAAGLLLLVVASGVLIEPGPPVLMLLLMSAGDGVRCPSSCKAEVQHFGVSAQSRGSLQHKGRRLQKAPVCARHALVKVQVHAL